MRVAIITGGAQGIGRVTAKELNSAGWQVALLDADAEALAEVSNEQIAAYLCDIADENQVISTIQQVVKRFGRLNALVNNAAIAANQPIEELTLEDWNRVLAVNLTGAFLMAKHCARHLRVQKGAIVNICSTRAHMSEPNTEAYSASKGGTLALTHALAMSLGPEIRVNSVSPGWIDVSGYQKTGKRRQQNLSEADHKQHPSGRVGIPHDISAMVEFLISENAKFITGQDYIVDGGMTRKMIYV